jgi:23S rRNA (uracil1939-C5)-methyltransferase
LTIVRDSVDATIVEMDANGDGVADVRGARIAVAFTIPGERVRLRLPARVSSDRPARAALIEVLEPSPHRVAPPCPHFGPQPTRTPPCGGCAWQHIAYPEQLRIKTGTVSRVVRAAVPDAPPVKPMLTATPEPWGFRHKVHFAFGDSGGRLTMGHLARGSRRIVPVAECRVHAAAGNTVAFALRDACVRTGVRGWEPGKPTHAALRGVAVRVGHASHETLTTLVVAHDRDRDLRAATRRALGESAVGGLHMNVHQRDDGMIFGAATRKLRGIERLREDVGGVSFLISPTAFFQTNVAAAELLVRLVLDAVPADVPVLDLYAGAGLFALALAKRGHAVTAVEESRDAVVDGQASQRLNHIPEGRCKWIAVPVEASVKKLPAAGAVILDPPREGCAEGVLDNVFRDRGPEMGAYVSCNPDTLGRDLATIVRHGYVVESVQPVDMFPHTPHIETVVVLRRVTAAN